MYTAIRSAQAVALALAAGVVLTVSGCAAQGESGGEGDVPADGTLTLAGGMFCSGAPLGFCDSQGGGAQGILPDLTKAWSAHIPAEVEIEGISWDALMPAAVSGRVDLIVGLGDQDERRAEFTFVDLFASRYSFVTYAENKIEISSVEDLCGQEVAVTTGSGEFSELTGLNSDVCASDPVVIREMSDQNVAFLAVQSKQVPITITDTLSAIPLMESNVGVYRELFAWEAPNAGLWGVAIPADNEELIRQVTDAVSKARADGSLQAVFEQYGADPDMILSQDMVNGEPVS